MRLPSLSPWWQWLLVSTSGVLLFSLSMLLTPMLSQPLFNWLSFGHPATPFATPATRYLLFVFGIYGVAIGSWMVALFFIILIPFRQGVRWAWWAIATSLGSWYVIDTTYSWLNTMGGNMALNTVLFMTMLVPLVATYPIFHRSTSSRAR